MHTTSWDSHSREAIGVRFFEVPGVQWEAASGVLPLETIYDGIIYGGGLYNISADESIILGTFDEDTRRF